MWLFLLTMDFVRKCLRNWLHSKLGIYLRVQPGTYIPQSDVWHTKLINSSTVTVAMTQVYTVLFGRYPSWYHWFVVARLAVLSKVALRAEDWLQHIFSSPACRSRSKRQHHCYTSKLIPFEVRLSARTESIHPCLSDVENAPASSRADHLGRWR